MRKTVLAAAAMLALALTQPAAAACGNAAEEASIAMRRLQTELMVAALSCGASGRYNDFVRKFEGELAANGRMMRKYFHRLHGKSQGEKRLNSFVTALANEYSTRNISHGGGYCALVPALFDEVMVQDASVVSAFASARAAAADAASGAKGCMMEAVLAAR